MLSCCNNSVYSRINSMIDDLELFPFQKTLLKNRFLEQVVLYDKKAKTAEFFYILFSVFITVGSIILPALLSIQQMDYSNDDKKDERIQITIYWITWTISLLITICNGLVQLLSLNKQYLSFTRTREKLLSEGWYYFQLTGDYKDTTHKDAFHDFCEEIEKIKEEQVDKELSFMLPKKKKMVIRIIQLLPVKELYRIQVKELPKVKKLTKVKEYQEPQMEYIYQLHMKVIFK